MAEQLLDRADVATILEQVRRERMAEGVAGRALGDRLRTASDGALQPTYTSSARGLNCQARISSLTRWSSFGFFPLLSPMARIAGGDRHVREQSLSGRSESMAE